MPIARTSYVPIPAAIPRRVSDTRTLGALLQRQGENTLQLGLSEGEAARQMWMQLGRAFSSYAQGKREDKDQAAAMELRKAEKDAADQLKRDEMADRKAERDEAARIRREAEQERKQANAAKVGDAVAESVGYGPLSEPQLDQVLQSPAQAGRARYSFGPGTADGPELMPTKDQQRAITAEDDIRKMGGKIGPNGQVVMPPAPRQEPNPTEASLAMMAARGDKGAIRALEILTRQKDAGRAPTALRSPIWVVGTDGQFQDLAGVAPPGSKPANTREQGRAVTSGDAGRIADFDTSMDDLGVLGSVLSASGSTGTTAKIGAGVPNWVTEYTGWGADAKKKQALIDRVKQVIGKALEGGVLRKEDEVKYEKILPTVGDPNDLVLSKLAGLGDAIKLRRTRTIESLEDAGYDVSKFQARGSMGSDRNLSAVPDLNGVKPGMGRKFTDGPFKGQTWSVGVDGKPFKVGG